MKYKYKYIAAVTLEAKSVIAVNSGEQSLLMDNAVARDANGLPYLPGTSIAGVLRHLTAAQDKEMAKRLFGFAEGKKGEGSRLFITDAHLTAADGKNILDGLCDIDSESAYIKTVMLPRQRDQVRINHRGAAAKTDKYNRSVLPRGVRFGFEIEFMASEEQREEPDWDTLIELLTNPLFRIGAGTRNGAGGLKVIQLNKIKYDLTDTGDCKAYLNKTAELNNDLRSKNSKEKTLELSESTEIIKIKPEDFFFFGTSLPDSQNRVDNIYKTEKVIDWGRGKGESVEMLLFPATSIKGALRHRTAYHYNRLTGAFLGKPDSKETEALDFSVQAAVQHWNIDEKLAKFASEDSDDNSWKTLIAEIEAAQYEDFATNSKAWQNVNTEVTDRNKKSQSSDSRISINNAAAQFWFGSANDDSDVEKKGHSGRLIIEDIYAVKDKCHKVLFNHVRIDRLTGGAYGGMLFQEEALYSDNTFELLMTRNVSKAEEAEDVFKVYEKALNAALNDLKTGMLPLGGATTKGYGVFTEVK